MQKPRKKLNIFIAVFILLLGVCVGGYLVLASKTGQANKAELSSGQIASIINGKTILACSPNPGDQNSDVDDDGLKDWQETQIYKTDSCKADSDGDGYLDGEETAAGYDPNVKAPNDKLSDKSVSPRPAPKTLTKQFIEKIIAGMQAPGFQPLDSADNQTAINAQAENLINAALAGLDDETAKINLIVEISDKDIKITENSPETIAKYLADISALLKTNFSQEKNNGKNNFDVIKEAVSGKNPPEIDIFLNTYQNSADALKKMTVPLFWKNVHKELLSYFLSSVEIFKMLKSPNNDPLKNILILREYMAVFKKINNVAVTLDDLNQKLKQQNEKK